MRFFSRILIDISFFPLAALVVNLVKTFFTGIGGNSVLGVVIPLKFGIDAVIQRLYIDFSWNMLGKFLIPIFAVCFIYHMLCIMLVKTKVSMKKGRRAV